MKINVIHVGAPWKATPTSDPLYTIHIEGQGEPQKTFDAALASLGEHEAESYQAKSGKTYWRVPKQFKPKGFQADPTKLKQDFTLEVARNQSIQRQVAYKGVVDLICHDKIGIDEFEAWFNNSIMLLSNPAPTPEAQVEDAGDFAKFIHDDTTIDDLPPVENYDE